MYDHKWNGITLNKTLSLRLQSSLGLDRNRNVKGLVKGDSGERWSTPIENYFLPDFKSLGRGRLSSQPEARTARQGGAVILPVGSLLGSNSVREVSHPTSARLCRSSRGD